MYVLMSASKGVPKMGRTPQRQTPEVTSVKEEPHRQWREPCGHSAFKMFNHKNRKAAAAVFRGSTKYRGTTTRESEECVFRHFQVTTVSRLRPFFRPSVPSWHMRCNERLYEKRR